MLQAAGHVSHRAGWRRVKIDGNNLSSAAGITNLSDGRWFSPPYQASQRSSEKQASIPN
jgi:hypothetical protein